MLKTKTKSLLITLIIGLQIALVPTAWADFLPVRAYATDTVAGYASMLKTSLINPGQKVIFVVEKPDNSVIKIPAEADLEGIAKADLYGHQTKIAGQYKAAIIYPGSPNSSPQATFTVFADQLSVTQSTISSTQQMLSADSDDKTFVTVTLYDSYRNPIKGHAVQLISSREEDDIEVLSSGVTDGEGRVNFKITSTYPGISTLTALDSTLNQILNEREEIVFHVPVSDDQEIGGNLYRANLFDANNIGQSGNDVLPGPVDHFDIEDLPSSIKVGKEQNMTIIARDKNGNIAKNYTGTILISILDDENAILPNNGEYTFKENDQGKFTFSLALQFSKIGKQTVKILDKDNWKIAGEKEVEVIAEQAINPNRTSNLIIKSPDDGVELGNSLVIINGQGDPNINLKIFDNDVKIGNSETDADGFFSYQAKNLLNGSHSIYAMSDNGDVSSSVTVQVDTLPPVLNYFEISPDGTVKPGESLVVTVQSEPNLEEVKIRLQGVEEFLVPSATQPGTYEATVAAPVADGSFPVDVILIDSLANKAELLNKATIQVIALKELPPPKVEGLEGVVGNQKVTLNWKAVAEHERPIQKYRIYYGTHFDQLNEVVETEDNKTTWYISDLTNNTQYFFAIRAVDSKGLESEELSVTIAVTSIAPEPEPISPPIIPVDSTVQGIALDGGVSLNWQAFPGIQAYYYKIYFGMQSGHYDDYIVTPNNTTSFTIPDLINNIPYYFAVVALDINGREISSLSSEFTVTPGGSGYRPAAPTPSYNPPLHNASSPWSGSYNQNTTINTHLQSVPANEKTGPEAIWLVVISLVFTHFGYNYYRRHIY